MRSLRFVAVSALLMFAVACGGGYSAPPASPSPTPPSTTIQTGTPVSIPRGAATLGNRAYTPDDLNVAVGTTVTWTNTDSEAHTTTSDGTGWNSTLAPGGQFSFVFQTAGTFPYHCTIHPGMVGTVVVR